MDDRRLPDRKKAMAATLALFLGSQRDEWIRPPSTLNSSRLGEPVIPTWIPSRFHALFDEISGVATMDVEPVVLELQADVKPLFCKSRPIPINLREKAESEIQNLVRENIIEPTSYSKWASPLVLVHKKDTDKLRLCVDFKVTLNRYLTDTYYQLPLIQEIYSKLNNCTIFSTIDLKSAFNQVPLHPDSRSLTTISTPFGLYQYTVLPFGLKTAPSIFQALIEKILGPLPGVAVYIDDIVIGGSTLEEHDARVIAVCEKLLQARVAISPDKCRWRRDNIKYLGHVIDAKGIHPDPDKIEAIKLIRAPQSVKLLRSFLGMVNYYARFIPHSAQTLGPLYALLKKGAEWNWSEECQKAFEEVKLKLTTAPILVPYDRNKNLVVYADASQYGLGAILAHEVEINKEIIVKPIAFMSRRLTPVEERYGQVEKEGLALVSAIKHWHTYLLGRHFRLITDHRPLVSIFAPESALPKYTLSRLFRWALFLSEFEFTIEYRDTDRMLADYLSRSIYEKPAFVGFIEQSDGSEISAITENTSSPDSTSTGPIVV